MGTITSATTTNRDLLKKQQATLDNLARQSTDLEVLTRDLIKAIKEITDK